MNRIISLGLDRRWRRRTRRRARRSRPASRVLDLACGTGDLCRDLAARGLPRRRRRLLGRDARAPRTSTRRSCAATARALPFADGAFDGVVCGFALRNFVDLDAVFAECARVLRARRPVRRARRRRARRTRSCAPATRCGSAARSAARAPARARRRGLPLPPQVAPRTSRRAPSSSTRLARAGFADVAPHHAHRRLGAAAHRDAGMTTTPTPAPRLRAVTREVDPADDRARRLRPRRLRMAARRHAARHRGRRRPRRARRRRRRARGDRRPTTRSACPGTGALAVGALPFDPDAAGELVIPARVVGALDGRGVGHRDRPAARPTSTARPSPPDAVHRRRATRRATSGARRSSAALDAIDARRAREGRARPRGARRGRHAVRRPRRSSRGLVAQQPGCFVYASDGFVGASPELLVRRTGDRRRVAPGGRHHRRRQRRGAARALAASAKDAREHRFVVDAHRRRARRRAATALDASPRRPRSRCSARSRTSPRRSAARLARRRRPSALDARPAAAPDARGRRHAHAPPRSTRSARSRASTAGATPARSAGSTPAATASGPSRCAAPSSTAPAPGCVAGAGIVAGSDPDAEWAETQAKLEPMLRALVRP